MKTVQSYLDAFTTALKKQAFNLLYVDACAGSGASTPTDFIQKVWAVMAACPQHQFQVLTKRPERMAELFTSKALTRLPQVWIVT